jgi:CheY-like chemotaxis protein
VINHLKVKIVFSNGHQLVAVNDNTNAKELLKAILERSCAGNVVVSSRQEALEAVRDLRPDILICDLAMPEMNGYEVPENVRQLGPELGHLPAIALQPQLVTRIGRRPDWLVSKHICQNRSNPKD